MKDTTALTFEEDLASSGADMRASAKAAVMQAEVASKHRMVKPVADGGAVGAQCGVDRGADGWWEHSQTGVFVPFRHPHHGVLSIAGHRHDHHDHHAIVALLFCSHGRFGACRRLSGVSSSCTEAPTPPLSPDPNGFFLSFCIRCADRCHIRAMSGGA